MKMIICIIQNDDKDSVTKGLNEAGFRLTLLPSTGAYFRRGNSTLMIGVEDEQVDEAIQVIRNNVTEAPTQNMRRGTLFVLNVAQYEQI